MQIYTYSGIGDFHINHNEDQFVVADIGSDKKLLAVLDGCSMGIESHFAATLSVKLLRKIAKEQDLKSFAEKSSPSAKQLLAHTLKQLVEELKTLQTKLDVSKYELLHTLVLGILDTKKQEASFIIVGDGLICCNHKLYDYDQENQPDYLGYHLTKDFDEWFANHAQKLDLQNVKNLCIATDGIFTFQKISNTTVNSISEQQIIDFLLMDTNFQDSDKMLNQKSRKISFRISYKSNR
jgi:Protein phosphatase 2C